MAGRGAPCRGGRARAFRRRPRGAPEAAAWRPRAAPRRRWRRLVDHGLGSAPCDGLGRIGPFPRADPGVQKTAEKGMRRLDGGPERPWAIPEDRAPPRADCGDAGTDGSVAGGVIRRPSNRLSRAASTIPARPNDDCGTRVGRASAPNEACGGGEGVRELSDPLFSSSKALSRSTQRALRWRLAALGRLRAPSGAAKASRVRCGLSPKTGLSLQVEPEGSAFQGPAMLRPKWATRFGWMWKVEILKHSRRTTRSCSGWRSLWSSSP